MTLAASLLVACHLFIPELTPQPKELLFDTQRYLQGELALVSAWAAVITLFSQGVATVLALGLLQRLFWAVVRRSAGNVSSGIHASQSSAWWVSFNQYPAAQAIPYVGCQLSNGSYVSGLLHSYSRDWQDVPDRDLVLLGPIRYRPVSANDPGVLEDVGMVIVSARNIEMITVTYQPADSVDDPDMSNAVDVGTSTALVRTPDAPINSD